ncbi:helix-turn-helix transcriptional regulator [Acinetobacter baumannii]|uniref:helix-turn-helix domain-containing protein n=1 Tax=Acinetobacter baumannii TaxID=470 RepID=UPI000710416A|nr:helix-turn-helix transcriptional regulator [Acinetobacter baumannii]EHU2882117.1 helix-turn-helix transcriptional regulator [Acinetobacter baumannii]EHU3104675.1 helix-turn-helix transcriptional regulator [Acinetobacter baumannii]EHU3329666.1 helix-turn-helix transcriptional regulator [Acinetobacter baumannii]EHU3415562.1 helix-turn-helix transcriptional regulator [Acinetobacter baumannii]EIB6928529.1 helix-turn-helix transcriptional regulator [Acinetobacter baumannii]
MNNKDDFIDVFVVVDENEEPAYQLTDELTDEIIRAIDNSFNKSCAEKIEALHTKIIITSAEEIFGYMLYLFRKNLGLNQTEMGQVIGGLFVKYTRSGYSKLERGDSGISIQIIFHLSSLISVHHCHLFAIYDEIIKMIAFNKKFNVHFKEPIGLYGFGTLGITTEKLMKKSVKKELGHHQHLKFDDVLGQHNLRQINKIIESLIPDIVRESIQIRAKALVETSK